MKRKAAAIRLCLLIMLSAGGTQGQPAPKISLPDVMAVEMPQARTEIAPTDPPLRDLLTAVTSDRRRVTNDLNHVLTIGAARVTWSAWNSELGTGTPAATRAGTIFVLPYGTTPAGVSGDDSATAANNGVHIAHDRYGRVHMVWVDSGRPGGTVGPVYRRGVVGEDGVAHFETPPFYLAEGAPADWNAYPALSLHEDTVDVVWQGGGKAWTRRLTRGASGYVWGPVRDTGAHAEGRDSGPTIVSTGDMVHIMTPSGIYALSTDGGVTWHTEPMPIPPNQHLKTASLALDPAGEAVIAFSSIVRDRKETNNNEGSGGYWQLRIIRRTLDGRWIGAADALAEFPVWGEPFPAQDALADWARIGIDRANGLHLTWHGTAVSHVYGNDQAFYAYRPSGGQWRQPVPLVPTDPARGIKFSFAPSLTLEGEQAFATVFYDVYDATRWAGFDAVLVPLWDGAPTSAPVPVSQFVRGSIERKAPDFALSSKFPAAASAVAQGPDGRSWLDFIETLTPMGVPDSSKLVVWQRIDVSTLLKR